MEFRILGPLEVLAAGETLPLGEPRQRALLALLLLHPNEVISTDRILNELWPGQPPKSGALYYHVSKLRRALGAAGEEVIVTQAPGYRIAVDPESVDVVRFQRLTDAARQRIGSNPETAAEQLRGALAMWRGAPLADVAYEEFAQAEIQRLEEMRLRAVEDRIEADLRCDRAEDVVDELVRLVTAHPLRERLRGHLMVALYRCGRQAEALHVYQDTRRTLGEELGIEPTEHLRDLEERILLQDPTLLVGAPARALPAGTVTFLFTDVVGSTRLWEARPDEMLAATTRHDAILEAAIDEHHGVLVKHTGDGVFAAFHSAPDAVACAVAAQRGLLRERWPGGTQPQVRMGIHSGEAEAGGGDYSGVAVNRTARLAEAGSGGQILLSLATAELVRDVIPADIELVDLGIHQLRDLSRPDHLFQVAHPDLDAKFPPLSTLDTFPHNLPTAASAFVGRTEALRAVGELLDRSRLLTIHGVGGAGKTRVALQTAADRVEAYPDGVWLAQLAMASEDAEVAPIVAGELGARPVPGVSFDDAIVEWGRRRDALLLLDNCEHVVGGAAQLAGRLLDWCPDLSILTTSRQPLGIDGEARYEIGTMDVPDPSADLESVGASEAVQLFAARATAQLPDFRVTAANAAPVAAICRSLDGIPLAIELAAARLPTLNPAEIARRLEDSFRLLAGGSRRALPRQQTLEATFEWSYDLLGAPEATLFERLAVFRGAFPLEAVEAVCGGDPVGEDEVLDLLAHLVERSMVTVDREGDVTTYRLLETLRRFGEERLTAHGEAAELAARHAAYFASFAEKAEPELRGADEVIWTDRLDAAMPNLRRAVAWSLQAGSGEPAARIIGALKLYWVARDDLIAEVRRWVQGALRYIPENEPVPLTRVLSVGGLLAWAWGDLEEAGAMQRRALELARVTADDTAIFRAGSDLGLVAVDQGDLEEARRLFTDSLEIARRLNDPIHLAHAVSNLGHVEVPSRQRELLQQALQLYEDAGRASGISNLRLMLGWLELGEGRLEAAAELFTASRAGWEELANRSSACIAVCGLADVATLRGDYDAAAALLDETLETSREMEWPMGVAMTLTRTGLLVGARATTHDPRPVLREAGDQWKLAGLDPGLARTLGLLARANLDRGDQAAAADDLQRSFELWREVRRDAGLAWTAVLAADLERAGAGDDAALSRYLAAAGALAEAVGQPAILDGLLSPETGGVADQIDALQRTARCAIGAAAAEFGVELLAAAAAAGQASGIVPEPPLRSSLRQVTAAARGKLGARFDDAWAAGAERSVMEALEFAAQGPAVE